MMTWVEIILVLAVDVLSTYSATLQAIQGKTCVMLLLPVLRHHGIKLVDK